MLSIIIKFLFVLTLMLFFVNNSFEQECNARGMQKFDQLNARLMWTTNSGRKLPTAKDLKAILKTWCKESEDNLKELEKHKVKCFKGLNKQVFGIFFYAIKNTMKQYCKRDNKKVTELLEAVPCFDKHEQSVTKCYTSMIDNILGAKNAPDTKKIPYLCCEYGKVIECMHHRLVTQGGCQEKHFEAVSDMIKSIAGNVISLICGDYTESSDKCDSLGSPPKKTRAQKRTKSIALPIADLLASFPEV